MIYKYIIKLYIYIYNFNYLIICFCFSSSLICEIEAFLNDICNLYCLSVTFKTSIIRLWKVKIHILNIEYMCISLRVWKLLWKVWFRHQAFHSCQIFLSQSADVMASLCSAKWAFLPENISTQEWTALPVLMKSFCQHEQKQCLSYLSTLHPISTVCSEEVYKTWALPFISIAADVSETASL